MENIGKRLLEFCCDKVQSVPGHSSISELCMVRNRLSSIGYPIVSRCNLLFYACNLVPPELHQSLSLTPLDFLCWCRLTKNKHQTPQDWSHGKVLKEIQELCP